MFTNLTIDWGPHIVRNFLHQVLSSLRPFVPETMVDGDRTTGTPPPFCAWNWERLHCHLQGYGWMIYQISTWNIHFNYRCLERSTQNGSKESKAIEFLGDHFEPQLGVHWTYVTRCLVPDTNAKKTSDVHSVHRNKEIGPNVRRDQGLELIYPSRYMAIDQKRSKPIPRYLGFSKWQAASRFAEKPLTAEFLNMDQAISGSAQGPFLRPGQKVPVLNKHW